MKSKNYQVSEGRKTLYYLGMGLAVLGGILFISFFFTSLSSDPWSGPSFGTPVAGFVMILVGTILMGIGRLGLAGSGVILDPEKAREDLEPFARQGGGMLSDALEEVEPLKSLGGEVIRVRCPHCKALNEEDARFCNQCGKAV